MYCNNLYFYPPKTPIPTSDDNFGTGCGNKGILFETFEFIAIFYEFQYD